MKNLHIGYYKQGINLPDINGYFKSGSINIIIGANGVGKSTFLKTLAGLLVPISGKLIFKDKYMKTSYFPQRFYINYQFPLTVFDVVAMGCWPKVGLFQKISKKQQFLILEALKHLKLEKILKKNISVLSVGQFQCMLFARLLVQKASLILLDEPFTNIDNRTCDLMLSVIYQLHKKGSTIIMAMHNNKMITKYFHYILLLSSTVNFWQTSLKKIRFLI